MPFDGKFNSKILLLEQARKIINNQGLSRGKSYDGNKRCIYSAVIEANGGYRNWEDFGLGPFPAKFSDTASLEEVNLWFDERIKECLDL